MRFVTLALATSLVLASLAACSKDPEELGDDDASSSSSSGAGPRTSRPDSGRTRDGGDAGDEDEPDADTQVAACDGEMALYTTCGNLDDLLCPQETFVEWCELNNRATESEQRIAARAACLQDPDHCDTALRADCIYQTYNDAELTAAQQSLLTHYCQTCEPADPAACEARTKRFDPGADVDSIFLATWELAETLVKQIDEECIERASADAGACATLFDKCAGDVYTDALPNCPE